jgi:hypothetical protein
VKAPVKLGVFALTLLVVFGAAWGVGRLVGPRTTQAAPAPAHSGQEHVEEVKVPGGLQISQDGYRLEVLTRELSAKDAETFSFRVTGPDGKPLTAYTTAHDKDLHLVLVRRDLTGFQHLHPTLKDGGVWEVPLKVAEPGAYRMFADFQPAGREEGLILGADVNAPGDYHVHELEPGKTTATVDGYTVTLKGDLVPGSASRLTLEVSKDGRPVTDLEPYLGAFGHLVALRDGDLAYLHVHPQESKQAGPEIVFYAEVPSAGTYGLFLDFQHAGKVRTADFSATAGQAAAPAPAQSGHGHK